MVMPPALYLRFFSFENKDTPMSILSVLTGYICVLRYASAVKDVPEHAVPKQRAHRLEVANMERAKVWGQEAAKSVQDLCALFEMRIMYIMAIFHVVSNGLEDYEVESVFLGMCSKWLCKDLQVVEDGDSKEAAVCKKLYRHIRG